MTATCLQSWPCVWLAALFMHLDALFACDAANKKCPHPHLSQLCPGTGLPDRRRYLIGSGRYPVTRLPPSRYLQRQCGYLPTTTLPKVGKPYWQAKKKKKINTIKSQSPSIQYLQPRPALIPFPVRFGVFSTIQLVSAPSSSSHSLFPFSAEISFSPASLRRYRLRSTRSSWTEVAFDI